MVTIHNLSNSDLTLSFECAPIQRIMVLIEAYVLNHLTHRVTICESRAPRRIVEGICGDNQLWQDLAALYKPILFPEVSF